MKNLITKFMIGMGIVAAYIVLTASPASASNRPVVTIDDCKSVVVLDEKSGASFTTSVLYFCSNEEAEHFADAVNAEPISTIRAARFTVKRHATVYPK